MSRLVDDLESSHGSPLNLGCVKQRLQPLSQYRRKFGAPRLIERADANQVAYVRAGLVAERGTFDADKGIEIEHAKCSKVRRLSNVGIGRGLPCYHELAAVNDVYSRSRICIDVIKKQIHAGTSAMNKPF